MRSALRHSVTAEDIGHAIQYWLLADTNFEDSEPPKVLILGPDEAGNLLEVVGRENGRVLIVFHAMPAREVMVRLLRKSWRM